VSADIGKRYAALTAGAVAAVICLGVVGLAGCHRAPAVGEAEGADSSRAEAKEEASKGGATKDGVTKEGVDKEAAEGASEGGATKENEEGVSLTSEEVEKLGVVTESAEASDYVAEIVGYGVVVPHDAIAIAVAELATARAAQEQSRAVAARAQRLTGTPGAMSADVVEIAARQLATDAAALALAEHRLSSVIGVGPPAGALAGGSTLQDLASGKIKLVRATFALGALRGAPPASLRSARLDAASPGGAQVSPGWTLHTVWNAPADASLPGRSFFALLKDGDASEGERLLVWAPGTGPAVRGVTIPASALVISGGRYWCYVEQKPGVYARREVVTERPVGDAFVVTQNIAVGDKIVTSAAALLLAREMNPSTEADSD
jgi:hypothetical protein